MFYYSQLYSIPILDISNTTGQEKNQIVPGVNPTGGLAGLRDLASLR